MQHNNLTERAQFSRLFHAINEYLLINLQLTVNVCFSFCRKLTDVRTILNFKHVLFVDVSGNYLTLDALQVLTEMPYLVLLKAERNLVESAALQRMPFLQVGIIYAEVKFSVTRERISMKRNGILPCQNSEQACRPIQSYTLNDSNEFKNIFLKH